MMSSFAAAGLLQATLLVLAVATVLGADSKHPVHVEGSYLNTSSVYVSCQREIFSGTRFYGSDRVPQATAWITRNQLLIEGISPMVSMDFVSTTDLTTGIMAPMLIVNSTGPLYTKAASWEPLYYRPEDAACSLARANAQYQAAHPTGPLLLMNATVLSGPLNKEIGAWQPQGFYTRIDSAKEGLVYGAQRLYDHGNRPNPIRSITKALTAATFMALTEKNIIGLDEFAADYVPAFKQGKLAEITFRMLMSHSAGLPMIDGEGQALLDPEITLMESATIIAKTYPLQFPPGQGFTYTEIGFQVVGAAMEAATGRSLQSLVRHYITGPIGMNDTHIYNQWKRGFSTNPSCAFGGVSTPNNLRAFLRMLLARGLVKGPDGKMGRVLSQASIKEMTTPQAYSSGFQALISGSVDKYVPYLLQNKLMSPAAASILKNIIFGKLGYGLGMPLSQVTNGKARNVVLIGGAGQMYVIVNFADPNTALLASSSNFQYVIWGYIASTVLLSEIMAGLA